MNERTQDPNAVGQYTEPQTTDMPPPVENTEQQVTDIKAPAEITEQTASPEPSEETAKVEEPAAEEGPQTYKVESGDTLSAIAQRFYGDANSYMKIFEANRDKLNNPDLIHAGQELTIPR